MVLLVRFGVFGTNWLSVGKPLFGVEKFVIGLMSLFDLLFGVPICGSLYLRSRILLEFMVLVSSKNTLSSPSLMALFLWKPMSNRVVTFFVFLVPGGIGDGIGFDC